MMVKALSKSLILALLLASCSQSKFSSGQRKSGGSTSQEPAPTKNSMKFEQINYQTTSEDFTQGFLGTVQKESLKQITPSLDLLIVIDNSLSMSDDQDNVASKMPPLLSEIDQSDWQIAIVTTHRSEDSSLTPYCFRDLIKKSDPNASERYSQAIRAGDRGNGMERGLPNALLGLKGECLSDRPGIPNQTPWIRENSIVSILVVSDEDNCSLGDCFDNVSWKNELTNYLTGTLKRKMKESARFYGILTLPDSTIPEGAHVGRSYMDLVEQSSGKMGSIRDQDFTNTLRAISLNLSEMLKTKIELTDIPDDPSQIEVTLDGKRWSSYTITNNAVTFTEVPPSGSLVEVSYVSGKTGEYKNTLVLKNKPLLDSFKITLDGKDLDKTLYVFNESENSITFPDKIPEKSSINISYKIDVPLTSSFDIGKDIKKDSIEVKVDSKDYDGKIDFDTAKKSVILTPPPKEGSKIEILFFEINEKK